MLYNLLESKKYVTTAGKITIATAIVGVLVVAFVFLFNAGKTELMKVEAQTATTTLTVLNTPPQWVSTSTELIESSVTNPTNSGTLVSWRAVATDANQPNYYLLVCSTTNAPSSTNGGVPHCNGGVQWGVSSPTAVGTQAVVATTTTEVSPFAYSNNWYAWICDDDVVNARCNSTYTNGTNATNSSPFIVNSRPVFSSVTNSSPADPGASVLFTSSSTDPNGDTLRLIVCSTNSYSTTTGCAGSTLATTTIPAVQHATATYVLPNIIQDAVYNAYTFVIDQFNHAASGGAQGSNSQVTVNNVAPTVSNITVNGGLSIILTQPGAETTGYTLQFTTSDANSCRTSVDALEIVDYNLALYRSSIGTSSCDGTTGGQYNPNNCYSGEVATTTWNLTCTASTTSCALGGGDATMDWSCSYPLWFIADPTDAASPYSAEDWRAAASAVDDDTATGILAASASGVELNSFTAIDLLSASIPYGQLEPGQNSGTLNASTTILSQGNTGLDQSLEGESMCITFSVGNECLDSASSTISESEQEFATSSLAYGSGTNLSSSTPQELELNVLKSTSTTTPNSGVTYWGINVPIAITLAGSYTGLNTFTAVTSEAGQW